MAINKFFLTGNVVWKDQERVTDKGHVYIKILISNLRNDGGTNFIYLLGYKSHADFIKSNVFTGDFVSVEGNISTSDFLNKNTNKTRKIQNFVIDKIEITEFNKEDPTNFGKNKDVYNPPSWVD